MTKSLRFPLVALLAVSTLLAAVPAAQAALSHKSLLKKIYNNSDDGDGNDIHDIIRRALEKDTEDGEDVLKKLFKALKNNRAQLDDGVSEDDLDRIFKKLRKWVKSHPPKRNNPPKGPITPPESSIVNS